MTNEELEEINLTQESIEAMIYEIKGQRVMLDFDLARIYGYETKRFNEQVKRNIDKFDEDFMFRITRNEIDILSRSQNVTTMDAPASRSQISTTIMQAKGIKGGRVYLPYAFTEQGIYMLMTVLKGELAIKQSKALIRLFKKMKDYIVENTLALNNASIINDKFASYDKRFETMENKLEIVMDNFIDPSTHKRFAIMDGQKIEADLAYQTIYSLAKSSIIVIDDYISIKTLHLLLSANKGVGITIISDNVSNNPVTDEYLEDFIKESDLKVAIKPSNNRCHDRYIAIDYKSDNEKIYMSGSSSKDAGNKITMILDVGDKEICYSLIDSLLT
ncbi:MAG: ORF6N domain-containing protein [Bacilli bacterium]|nr:ORF6N domain-containing protein [Bacilli bacterium]